MTNMGEMLYQMECCGDLPTRQGKLNQVIHALRYSNNPNDLTEQQKIFSAVGLDPYSLSKDEIEYIETNSSW